MLDSPRVVLARGLSPSRTPQAGDGGRVNWISVSDRFPMRATSARGRELRERVTQVDGVPTRACF
jgi:hypothetical protein